MYPSRRASLAARGVILGSIGRTQGCMVTDADVHSYIDCMGANGPSGQGADVVQLGEGLLETIDERNFAGA